MAAIKTIAKLAFAGGIMIGTGAGLDGSKILEAMKEPPSQSSVYTSNTSLNTLKAISRTAPEPNNFIIAAIAENLPVDDLENYVESRRTYPVNNVYANPTKYAALLETTDDIQASTGSKALGTYYFASMIYYNVWATYAIGTQLSTDTTTNYGIANIAIDIDRQGTTGSKLTTTQANLPYAESAVHAFSLSAVRNAALNGIHEVPTIPDFGSYSNISGYMRSIVTLSTAYSATASQLSGEADSLNTISGKNLAIAILESIALFGLELISIPSIPVIARNIKRKPKRVLADHEIRTRFDPTGHVFTKTSHLNTLYRIANKTPDQQILVPAHLTKNGVEIHATADQIKELRDASRKVSRNWPIFKSAMPPEERARKIAEARERDAQQRAQAEYDRQALAKEAGRRSDA